ncbi:Per os infectivity factor 6 [Trabala vishnou gigantina nucleopolyhedrovirus]|uniref:Per os infectivity factor 6 n=1 Tax=Trabala vishnou gigantina nucleopolyhedrovirus TaxID=2863583 RepID=UPI002481DFA1|nr:Per os infectivity factor 6 [Trabala vishnou gigantina nucleopolyhedrovirus]QYC92767.1 Per os infectivity factor 6 [Trabala vishnou gigantina nucleopolyhedrovirus]
MVRWRMLNSDRVEITPEDRKEAWQNLFVDILKNCPASGTYRTLINKANFKYFDYKRPIVYEISNKTLLINSEFLNKTLNRPRAVTSSLNVQSYQILLAYICTILIILLIALNVDSVEENEPVDTFNR